MQEFEKSQLEIPLDFGSAVRIIATFVTEAPKPIRFILHATDDLGASSNCLKFIQDTIQPMHTQHTLQL